MAHNSEDVQLLREGYLFKSPDSSKFLSIMKKWQRKWFRLLENGDLLYFDSDKSSKPVGTIPLLDCYRVFDPKSKGLQTSYCLGMEVGVNTYYIKAETASVYNMWLDVIAAFAEKNDARRASPSSSPTPPRRPTGSSEVRGHRGDSIASRTSSTSTKVRSVLVEKSGWLYKTGPNNKGWNHRFFVLSNGKLSYYKTDKAEKSLGSIDLRECTAVNQASVKRGYGLTVQVPSRTYYISAESESEQEEWMTAICTATSLLAGSRLSVTSEVQSLTRSGSGSSQSSITSRELFTASVGDAQTTAHHADGSLVLAEEDQGGGQDRRPERDSVVQLLEAEVDALRGQVSGLRDELQSSSAVTAQLQSQLQESMRQREREVHSLTVERDNLHTKLSELESAKVSLESVNDSLRLQLDEVRDQGLEAEELHVREELEETQAALTTAEEDVKAYQQELSETQQLLREIQSVAQDLQSELIKRGDYTPDLLHKNRSLSTTCTELLHLSSVEVPSYTCQQGAEERLAVAEGSLVVIEEGKVDQPLPQPLTRREAEEEGRGNDKLAEEERLKWQVEMENLRRECEQHEVLERDRHAGVVREMGEKVVVLEERCRMMTRAVEEGRRAKMELDQTRERLSVLENELSGARERVGQLQVEKEKALADLNNIRKINRTIEKRLSETGSIARGSHIHCDTEPGSTAGSAGMKTEDGRLEELSRQLDLIRRERDQLKARLEESTSANGPVHSGGTSHDELSPLLLRRKGTATVAASNYSLAAPSTYAERNGSFNSVASSLTNGHMPSEAAPEKPLRPSKAVISTKLMVANQNRGNLRSKTWGSAMFQNLFRGQN